MRYLLIDTANLFFRSRHVAFRASDTWERVGYALHITLAAVNKVARRFTADHVVFALEGRSWRKDHYTPYKRNRAEARDAMNPQQQEEEKVFWETYDQFTQYLRDQTNCSVIRCETAEADDVIARWIALHPQDHHTIISSDTDFVQLLSNNVDQYNGITDELLTLTGVFDAKNRPVIDKKTKAPKITPDPAWLLFEKCMRGDTSDNVFSAYPGVRTRGTKNRVGLMEAFADRDRQGFNWNNLMMQRWTDHEGQEHRVGDDYERNRQLIDLTAQPQAVKDTVDGCIRQQISSGDRGQVGMRFMRFCARFELTRAGEQAEQYSRWLNAAYQGVLND